MNIIAAARRYILTHTVILYRKLCHIQFYYEEHVASSSQVFMPIYQTTWYHIPKDSNLQILLEYYIYPNDYAPKWEAANKLSQVIRHSPQPIQINVERCLLYSDIIQSGRNLQIFWSTELFPSSKQKRFWICRHYQSLIYIEDGGTRFLQNVDKF
jgi:hypothetical protein